jgi:hypothetical protein
MSLFEGVIPHESISGGDLPCGIVFFLHPKASERFFESPPAIASVE